MLAWVVTFVQALRLHGDLTDIAEDWIRDTSAVQISQVADQSQLELMPYITAWFGLTTLFAVVLGYSLLKGRSR